MMRIGKWTVAVVLAGAALSAQADDERWYAATPKYGCIAYDTPQDFELELLLGNTIATPVERHESIIIYHDTKYVDIRYVLIQGVSRCRTYIIDNDVRSQAIPAF